MRSTIINISIYIKNSIECNQMVQLYISNKYRIWKQTLEKERVASETKYDSESSLLEADEALVTLPLVSTCEIYASGEIANE